MMKNLHLDLQKYHILMTFQLNKKFQLQILKDSKYQKE